MAKDALDDERDEELAAIAAIYPELCIDSSDRHSATLNLDVSPATPLKIVWSDPVRDVSQPDDVPDTTAIQCLPPLRLRISLPDGYPDTNPPRVTLATAPEWLDTKTLSRLEAAAQELWEDYGRSQTVFAYIDLLSTEAETVFGAPSPLLLPSSLKQPLIAHNDGKEQDTFEHGYYNCGVCLDPKPGTACYRMLSCKHVFCRACLQDFYSAAITQGEVHTVKCLDPDCGMAGLNIQQRRSHKTRTLHPRELLAIPLTTLDVQRYVNMKLKKKIESDKKTVYCPRQWCQAPARSDKYAKFFANSTDLTNYPDSDSELDEGPLAVSEQDLKTQSTDDNRLAICTKCTYAFCRNCHRSWHGGHVACRARPSDSVEISAEDKASEDWIRKYTSPCPTCDTPCQKLLGCNHMICTQCKTHFCYLCSTWLLPDDPYRHFNIKGRGCYMRLWDLEEGDRGDENPGGAVEFGGARGFEIGHVEGRNQAEQQQQQQQQAPAANDQGQRGLQRFLEMARNDEEDEWDSDGLEDEITEQLAVFERAR